MDVLDGYPSAGRLDMKYNEDMSAMTVTDVPPRLARRVSRVLHYNNGVATVRNNNSTAFACACTRLSV